jgi:GDP-L-fucose synthase
MKTILVTGSSGFIGKNFVEQLKDKYNLILPNHKELELTDQNQVSEFFKKNKIDIVLHLATEGGGREKNAEVKDIAKINLQMFFNIVNNSRHYKKLIQCGTGGEYDRRIDIKDVNEEDFGKIIPIDDYSFSKYVISKYLEGYKGNFTSLRFFAVFGKYENYKQRFISNAILKNLLNQPITINQNVFFDYINVYDIVKIIEFFINNDTNYNFYNVGTGRKIDLFTIAKKINQISSNKSEIIFKKKGLNKEFSCNNKKLMESLGNYRFKDIDESIRELYEYYKNDLKVSPDKFKNLE